MLSFHSFRKPYQQGQGNLFCFCLTSLIFFIFPKFLLAGSSPGDYSAIKKYLNARMFSEAYLELLRCELLNKEEDKKLTDLKKKLLGNTRKEVSTRVRANPNDAMAHVVLADVNFQEGLIEEGIQAINPALQNSSDGLVHYTFAKLLYRKGNIRQSYEEMEKALETDPSSDVIMEDFQFLHHHKDYGLKAAKQLFPNPGFFRRFTPLAGEARKGGPPESPFENDPTKPPEGVKLPEPDKDPKLQAKPPEPIKVLPPPKLPIQPPDEPEVEPEPSPSVLTPVASETMVSAQTPKDPMDIEPPSDSEEPPPPEDPEKKKIQEAEYWFEQAKRKFESDALSDSELNLQKVKKIYPGLVGCEELQAKIDAKNKIGKDFKDAIVLYKEQKFDLAREPLLKAYEENPDKYSEATFYLGKIYTLGSEVDLKKAKDYFEIYSKNPKADPDLKRDVEWIIIGILADDQQFEEAGRRLADFETRESEYVQNQSTYRKLKITLFYESNKTAVLTGFGVFVGAFILVFLLMLFPWLGRFSRDPLSKMKKAKAEKNLEKVVKVGEAALRGAKLPIQIERQILELCIEAHFDLKNYFKCKEHAKNLLASFPDSQLGHSFLSKSFLETKDISFEAISIYETMYKNNSGNKEFLPLLAKYYATQKQYTVESMGIMFAYFQFEPSNKENIVALADAFVQNKSMSDETVSVLQEALKIKPDETNFRELLARNLAKKGLYPEAIQECMAILATDVSNMGIHVVYTSCMKKLNMVEEAILQYEEFLKKHPKNPQLLEIVTGLRKEVEVTNVQEPALPGENQFSPFSDEMLQGGMDLISDSNSPPPIIDMDISGFTESEKIG
ncbi:hypothetical protein HYY75_08430 [bacterium]|nr:hypothetical protein [bacterium]